jgi:YggT family protein
MMLAQIVFFLFNSVTGFFMLTLLMRFYLQAARVPFNHPLAQFVVSMTNFAVLPLRRVVPSIHGYDTATLLLACITAGIVEVVQVLLMNVPFDLLAPRSLLVLALLSGLYVLKMSVYLLLGVVLMLAILSWVNPLNPLSPLLQVLARPFLAPLQRRVPPVSGFDLSPLLLLLGLQVILIVLDGLAVELQRQLVVVIS